MNLKSSKLVSEDRLLSLDFFRGITMFLLVAEGTHLWSVLVQPPIEGTIFEGFFIQFHHHPWNGLRFWDLIQPFFIRIFFGNFIFNLLIFDDLTGIHVYQKYLSRF